MMCTILGDCLKPLWLTDNRGNEYIQLDFRMYIHINPMTLCAPNGVVYKGSIYAPYKEYVFTPITLPAKTLVANHTFFVKSSPDVLADINSYVNARMDKFTQHYIWKGLHTKVMKQYIESVARKYNVKLDESILDYSTQFCWNLATR